VGVIVAIAIFAIVAGTAAWAFLNYTERGENLLIKWDFTYPPDCG
jgi:hypothetical protein